MTDSNDLVMAQAKLERAKRMLDKKKNTDGGPTTADLTNYLEAKIRLKDCLKAVDKKGMPNIPVAKDWMKLAHTFLRAVIEFQDKDGTAKLSDETWEEHPQFAWIGNILAQDGFIRQIKISATGENVFQYRITTKGLALFSTLETIDSYYEETVTKKEREKAIKEYGLKILAALSGLSATSEE